MNMPRLNRNNILYNIRDAREQLEEIERLLENQDVSVNELQAKLEHAYHHLNYAWNTRFVTDQRYKNVSDREFNEWSKFPSDIEVYSNAPMPEKPVE